MKHKRLTPEQRESLISKALSMSRQGSCSKKLSNHGVQLLETEFGVSQATIYNIWRRAQKAALDPSIHAYVAYTKKCGRRRKYDYDKIVAAVREMPAEQKVTLSQAAHALGITPATLRFILLRTGNYPTQWV